jgi:excisionase family DNA binding protein
MQVTKVEGADAFTLLDTAEACAALRVSKSTLHRLVKKGRIHRSTATVGRSMFPMSEIRRLIYPMMSTDAQAVA